MENQIRGPSGENRGKGQAERAWEVWEVWEVPMEDGVVVDADSKNRRIL